ncbi:tRNA-uridine aminocarboxypropyltransferase [Polaromonas sp. LjRoot131]|uniref:tRNA-uridine aminocarboxypropyltransferase n=1 Tax=Polaromonas sp. LjRoot131 TaxID=3342262 RepID=UPI003ECEF28C
MTELVPRRAGCTICLRPQSACICRWITPVAHAAEVLILQHPLEVDHAKNTGRLLHLSLPRSRMLTGETFDEAGLRAAMAETTAYTVLLYPPTPEDAEAPAALDAERLKDPAGVRLVVLDATWRKSRKMLLLNPLLRKLPRLSLVELPASNYRIRKAHKPGQLSTLEAVCSALVRLEGDSGGYQALLRAFEGFVAQQMAFRPV